jgi:hypothetical protein
MIKLLVIIAAAFASSLAASPILTDECADRQKLKCAPH